MSLADRCIVITGPGPGLGRALSVALADAGARVALLARGDAPETQAALRERGHEPFLVQADVTDEAGVRAAMATVADRYGRIDGLVNNAATFAGFTPLANITLEMFDHTFAVNVRGAFLCAREAVPYMRAAGRGRIVNISSDTFYHAPAGMVAHVSAKGALIGLTRALASELGKDGITVNVVIPGLFASPRSRELAPAPVFEATRARQAQPDRNLEPEDLVGTFLFLLSDAAARTTGQSFLVNSGSVYQ